MSTKKTFSITVTTEDIAVATRLIKVLASSQPINYFESEATTSGQYFRMHDGSAKEAGAKETKTQRKDNSMNGKILAVVNSFGRRGATTKDIESALAEVQSGEYNKWYVSQKMYALLKRGYVQRLPESRPNGRGVQYRYWVRNSEKARRAVTKTRKRETSVKTYDVARQSMKKELEEATLIVVEHMGPKGATVEDIKSILPKNVLSQYSQFYTNQVAIGLAKKGKIHRKREPHNRGVRNRFFPASATA